jgi:bifunctional UDP-N-acetylglucosamine pyrophosphorylase/glucosamine-1-phosphate N-acetyltransferase
MGTRMKSRQPKMLHPLGGRTLLAWVFAAASEAVGSDPIVVVGPEAEAIRQAFGGEVEYVLQAERLGTGHALLQAAEALRGHGGPILVINGDLPLLRARTLAHLIEAHQASRDPITLLTAVDAHARGFGRILRNSDGAIEAIVEELDAIGEARNISELNVGAYCFDSGWLWGALEQLPLSQKGEYYLTDAIGLAKGAGLNVGSIEVETLDEAIGVNTRAHLAEAERALRTRINISWMERGVSMQDPATTYIGPEVVIGEDTTLLPNTHLTGNTEIGSDCVIGPNTIIRDSRIESGCMVEASVVEGAYLEADVEIGPYAHLRKGAHLGRGVHMGNFGEVKNSHLEAGVKMGHFSYIGDAYIGENTNIGAGTITCNFDGERKQHTKIGANVFIGSDTMLVAPLEIGDGARTGAGSVVTRDIPPHSLAVGAPARVIRKLDKGD